MYSFPSYAKIGSKSITPFNILLSPSLFPPAQRHTNGLKKKHSRTSGDPAEGNHAVGPWARLFKYIRSHVLYMCINPTRYVLFCTVHCLFPDVRHDVLNIVHVSIAGFVICLERCSTMKCLSSWHCSVLIELYNEGARITDYNCPLWRIGMIHVRV